MYTVMFVQIIWWNGEKRDFLKIINLYSKCLNCNFFANLWRRDWPFEIPGKACLMNLKLKFYVMLKGLHLGKHFVFWYLKNKYHLRIFGNFRIKPWVNWMKISTFLIKKVFGRSTLHTVISSDWTLEKRALSNFAFQHC